MPCFAKQELKNNNFCFDITYEGKGIRAIEAINEILSFTEN